jgi:hypothetical protein
MKTKLAFLAVMVMATLLLFSGIAFSEGPPGDGGESRVDMNDPVALEVLVNRLAAGEHLSDEEIAGAEHFLTVDPSRTTYTTSITVHPPDDDGTAADGISGCSTNRAAVGYKNAFGLLLWAFETTTDWCYDGAYIVGGPDVDTDHEIYWWFWEYRGITESDEDGGDGDTVFEDFRQAHFALCFPLTGCADHKYPEITKWQYGTGSYDSDYDV